MKYPRTARIFRGQLDAAPFAGVFFLLLLFILLTALVYTPGIRIELPTSDRASAPKGPTILMAVDAQGNYFFENQLFEPSALKEKLAERVRESPEPLILEVRADQAVTLAMWIQLEELARDVGIHEVWSAILPRL